MSTSEQLMRLLKGGINNITIGLNQQGTPFIQCEQLLQTGPGGNMTKVMIQTEQTTIGAGLSAAAEQIEYCAKLHKAQAQPSNLIVPATATGGGN